MNTNKYGDEILENSKFKKIKTIEDYSFNQDGIIYKIVLKEYANFINIKYNKYELNLNLNDFNIQTFSHFISIEECFNFLSSKFSENNAYIKSILNKKYLLLSIYDKKINQDIDLKLLYQEEIPNSSLSELINNYNLLLSDFQKLKEEMYENKTKNLNNEEIYKNPKNIDFSIDIVKNSFASYSYEDSFIVFKSLDDILQLVYATKEKSIISYDINNRRNIFSQSKAHKHFITNFKYIFDEAEHKDIIMSVSKKDNNIKIWNANDWKLIRDISNVNQNNFLYSACFLKDNNNIFILTSNGKNLQSNQMNESFENIKVFNLEGKLIKEIEETNDCTYFIDIYFDNNLNKNFIVTGNFNYVKSYDFNNNRLYHKYNENNNGIHPSVIINKIGEKIKLIESCEDGNIRIWGFHSGDLIRKINTENKNLYGICLWNENYIFVGCKDQSIKIIELKNGLLIASLKGHNGRIISFKKLIQTNKEYLFSQGLDGSIKLWINS